MRVTAFAFTAFWVMQGGWAAPRAEMMRVTALAAFLVVRGGGAAQRAAARMAGGFGAPKQGRASRAAQSGAPPKWSSDALTYLARAKGDIDRAQSLYLSDAAKAVHARDPQAFSRLVAFKQDADATADAESHELLLQLTWDAVAAFMPAAAAPTREIERKLDRIARAATAGLGAAAAALHGGGAPTLLDIGCGDGALLPHVRACAPNCTSHRYVGIDLSPVMVERAKRAHPDATFEQCSFARYAASFDPAAPPAHGCVVLNGALQFFADQAATLAQAERLLVPGGCIVIAHVHGAEFVRAEHAGNKAVAVSTLPSRAELEAVAERLGMAAEEDEESAATGGEQFYLSILRKRRA